MGHKATRDVFMQIPAKRLSPQPSQHPKQQTPEL